MGIRVKKIGLDLEIHVMQDVARTLRKLPSESRERVVNWVASQVWSEEPASSVSSEEAQ